MVLFCKSAMENREMIEVTVIDSPGKFTIERTESALAGLTGWRSDGDGVRNTLKELDEVGKAWITTRRISESGKRNTQYILKLIAA
jgi:hypothetical protein